MAQQITTTVSQRASIITSTVQGPGIVFEALRHRYVPCIRLSIGSETSYVRESELLSALRIIGALPGDDGS